MSYIRTHQHRHPFTLVKSSFLCPFGCLCLCSTDIRIIRVSPSYYICLPCLSFRGFRLSSCFTGYLFLFVPVYHAIVYISNKILISPMISFFWFFFASENWWKKVQFSFVGDLDLDIAAAMKLSMSRIPYEGAGTVCEAGPLLIICTPRPTKPPTPPFLLPIFGIFWGTYQIFLFLFYVLFWTFLSTPFFSTMCVPERQHTFIYLCLPIWATHVSMCFSCWVSTYGLLAGNKTCFFNMQRLPLEGTQRRAEPGLWACSPLSFLLNLLQTVYDLCFDVTSALR